MALPSPYIFCVTGSCVPVAWQLSIVSNFVKALNAYDETPVYVK